MIFAEDIRAAMDSGPMIERYGRMTGVKFWVYLIVMFFLNAGACAVGLFRFSQWLRQAPFPGPKLSAIVDRFNLFATGAQVRADATIGPGLQIPHPQGVVVSSYFSAGKNLRLAGTGIAIGFSDIGGDPNKQFIEFGDDVTIATGAKVLGPLTIGDGASVGPNVVLMQSVPAGGVVMSSARAKVLKLGAEPGSE
ncbi:MAG: hypothetical protein JHD02_02050 [Thermoleophilaceae bacterium]|nr:hypothetical protein [Thermoleophilaceae bacterium]